MSTFYAAFGSTATAQQMAIDLLGHGVASDDISILAHESYTDLHPTSSYRTKPPTQDVSFFVGGDDDPEDAPALTRIPSLIPEDYAFESAIGGGIATSAPDDDISKVAESDESQSLAESESQPNRTEEYRETLDMQRAALTGFSGDIPRIDDFRSRPSPPENLDKALDTIFIPDFGVVMGGGPLATEALTYGGPTQGPEPLLRHFRSEGLDLASSHLLLEAFEGGGVVLEVLISRGSKEALILEELAERHRATLSTTVGAARY